jgi:TRAP-type uncharacterized transport system fused permease subunit
VFLISVWSELSPPTSLTAAVSARIAEASFLKTMYEALKICAPITLMTFAIFTRQNLVVNPGWLQILDTYLVLVSTCGITLAMFGRCHRMMSIDIPLRVLLAIVSFVVMFHPSTTVSVWVSVPVLVALILGVRQHQLIAPPKALPVVDTAAAVDADLGDLSQILAEAKREI